jgi:hypothetical protein
MPTTHAVAPKPAPRESASSAGTQEGRYSVKSYTLFLLASIALVEIVLGKTSLIWKLVPGNDIGGLFKLEEVVIANSRPRVLIFGSSRGREAFLPAQMEAQMGLERGQVLGLSLGGVSILDALLTYQRNRDTLSQAGIVVLQVDPFQLAASGYPPPARYREFASFDDRLAYRGRARARLFADYVFGMDLALPVVSAYFKDWLKRGRPPRYRYFIDDNGMMARVGAAALPENLHEARCFTGQAINHWLNWAYPDYQPSPIMEDQLTQLIRMAKSDGAEIYAVYLPTTAAYFNVLRKVPGDPYHHLQTLLDRMAAEMGIRVGWWSLPEDAGLTEHDFADWGHFNRAGARKWTAHFARWIQTVPSPNTASTASQPFTPTGAP